MKFSISPSPHSTSFEDHNGC